MKILHGLYIIPKELVIRTPKAYLKREIISVLAGKMAIDIIDKFEDSVTREDFTDLLNARESSKYKLVLYIMDEDEHAFYQTLKREHAERLAKLSKGERDENIKGYNS